MNADIDLAKRYLPNDAVFWSVASSAVLACFVGITWTFFGNTTKAHVLLAGAGIIFLIVFIRLRSFMQTRHFAGKLDVGLLSLNRCPSCLYLIDGLKTESDGCTVCPECNAAWRLPINHQQQQGASHA